MRGSDITIKRKKALTDDACRTWLRCYRPLPGQLPRTTIVCPAWKLLRIRTTRRGNTRNATAKNSEALVRGRDGRDFKVDR
jgi:hypothetical protein